eukprot:gene4274-2287_t
MMLHNSIVMAPESLSVRALVSITRALAYKLDSLVRVSRRAGGQYHKPAVDSRGTHYFTEEAYAVRATNPLQCRSAHHAFKPEAASNTRGQRPSGSWATSQSGLADNSCKHKERNSSEGTANSLPGHDVRFFLPFLQSAFHPSFILQHYSMYEVNRASTDGYGTITLHARTVTLIR